LPKPGEGYDIKKTNDVFEKAPPGYEGQTTSTTEVATGNTPATAGKTITLTVNTSTKVNSCPDADGTAPGDGAFSAIYDLTDRQPSGIKTVHAAMHSTAKFKGKVGDDAMLDGPVIADIDYNYTQSGNASAQNGGPIASTAPTDATQHITRPITVTLGAIPALGAVTGYDFMSAKLNEAIDAANALSFMGGSYYGVAELHWMYPDSCVHVVFNPPSYSKQPVPGSKVRVTAEFKTKEGEGVRGTFQNTEVIPGGFLTSMSNSTDPGSPAVFDYTAPATKVDSAGFAVSGPSRAGNAIGVWRTRLGTEWSGEITASKVSPGVDRNSAVQVGHHEETTRITISVKNGIGTAIGFSEIHGSMRSMHPVANNGHPTLEFDYGSSDDAMAEGMVKASAGVLFSTAGDRYTLTLTLAPFPTGKRQTSSCTRDKCDFKEGPYSVPPILTVMSGRVDDQNHVHGSLDLGGAPQFAGAGPVGGSYVITWDLSRTGTNK
jgi:hypothetical protein